MEDVQLLSSLPDDPHKLREIILQLSQREQQRTRERDEVARERDDWQVKFLRAEVELLRLKKWYYGPRADTLQTSGDVAQLLLNFAGELEARPVNPQDTANAADAGGDKASPSGTQSDAQSDVQSDVQSNVVRRVRRGRRNLAAFDHLPVTRKEYDLSDAERPCPCCGEAREKIGEETSWQVEYVPAHFERIEHVRLKYACKHCEHNADNPQITLADKPQQAIEKGMAGPGLLAYVVTAKYADYLPLYRLEAIFERNGLQVDRATQSVWCGDVADLVRPLHELMVRRVLSSHVVCTDDTVMPMLAPGKTRPARMWVYLGDEANPYNCFDFTLGRGRDGPATFLKEYKQTLLADAYGGYNGVVVGNGLTRAGCWAHARRKFVDAQKSQPNIAHEAVDVIRQLYAIEALAKDKSAEDRLCMRRSQTQPILLRLRERLWTWKDQLLPKHPMAEAVGYVLNQWAELNVFASDGAVPIDNNVSEREMKRVVLNRKNSLFVGNQRGGETAAILSSLTSTCRRHGINPQVYLTQLLMNLPGTPMSKLAQWLPDQWRKRNLPATA